MPPTLTVVPPVFVVDPPALVMVPPVIVIGPPPPPEPTTEVTWTKPQPAVKPVVRTSTPVMLIVEPPGCVPMATARTSSLEKLTVGELGGVPPKKLAYSVSLVITSASGVL